MADEVEELDIAIVPESEPVAQAEVADVAPETPEAPAEVQKQWYADLGDGWSNLPPDAAQERIRNQFAEQARQKQELEGYKAMLYRQQQAEQQRQLQAQQASQQQAKPKRNVPEYDAAWLDGVTRDEKTGQLVAKPGFMPDLPAKIQAYAKWREDELSKMARDPQAFFQEHLGEYIAQQAQQVVQSQIQPFQTQLAEALAVNRWEDDYADILFAKGGRNPQNPQYTPVGQQIIASANRHISLGIPKIDALNQAVQDVHYQLLMSGVANGVNGQTNGHAAPVNGTAAKPNVNGREEALRNATKQATRKPSKNVPEAGDRPRPRKSFTEIALAGLAEKGINAHDSVT